MFAGDHKADPGTASPARGTVAIQTMYIEPLESEAAAPSARPQRAGVAGAVISGLLRG